MKYQEFKKFVEEQKKQIQNPQSIHESEHLQIILDIVNSINKSLILEEVLQLVLKSAISFTESDRGFIVLKDDEGNLDFKLGINSEDEKLTVDDFTVSKTVVDDVFISGESKFIESAQSDDTNKKRKSIFNLDLQTILCSPLTTTDDKIGVIYVDSKHLHKIRVKEITSTFEILAGQAATAIHNAQLFNGQLDANKALEHSNKRLIIAKEEAEKSDRLKTEFLAQMSHEIRTPIHILMSYSNLIKDEIEDQVDEDLRSNFNAIEDAGKRIIRTTDLILNMSEVTTGTYEYVEDTFDLYENVLSSIYDEFHLIADSKKLHFNLIKETDNTTITADKYSVYQIFTNLIDNSVKYTDSGKIDLIIFQNNDGKVSVTVADTGIGIAHEYIPNLFKPFMQEDQGYSRRFEGNGLGLALVKNYCDLNQAEITLESKKGEGSRFTVTFK
ncbi:MAG: GAF domain-containing sensor histidine kinase [Bacteroidota bacterium]